MSDKNLFGDGLNIQKRE